ncbi:hypothetical protein HPB49_003610 [Dermacentor silvarum]|uniref:Uncharacterized protein n=1 Tax=Dermacentor silvarum TaxID=543639 RepID=A0ACB8CPH7_DERSI|nr:hypothetical protein HPB49_003610 [Dermacentor silvarum]
MASEQAPSRPSFLLDPLATDLMSFDADDTDSRRYVRLGDPLLSATGGDPFFGQPFGDDRSDVYDSPSHASFGFPQLFETRAEQVPTSPSDVLFPLAGPYLSRAQQSTPCVASEPPRLDAGTNTLAGLPLSRALFTASCTASEPHRSAGAFAGLSLPRAQAGVAPEPHCLGAGTTSLAGLALSRAQFSAQSAASEPPRLDVGTKPLAGLSLSRAQLGNNVEREPPRSADKVAALSDYRLPHAQPSDIFDAREPPRSAVDQFAGRVKPHAPVGAATQLSSMPFTGPLGSSVHVGEPAQVGPSQTAAPGTEQTPLHTAAAQLLQVLMEAARSQPSALKGDLQSPQPGVPSSLRVPLPEYGGYSDRMSATEYLEALHRYQQAMRLDDSAMLGTVSPVSLTAHAARWYRLVGHQARSMEEFRTLFRSEFLPPDYERRMRRELELRTQHPDESLLEYVRAMQELYLLADPLASDAEKVERAIRQAHPTFAAYLRSARYRDLNELASDAKRIQGDILAARAYCPPPPPSASLEPRCAWAGGDSTPRNPPKYEATREYREARDLSDRALDPYSYARARCSAPHGQREREPRAPAHEGKSDRGAPLASEGKPPSARGAPRPPQSDRGVVCYRC